MQSVDGKLVMGSETLALMNRVQREGSKVTWRSDQDVWGVQEKWAYPKEVGHRLVEDCDGISLYKSKLMLEAGAPASAVLMTICRDPNGGGHAVLCVTTDRGDFILCSNHVGVVTVNEMRGEGYVFLYRQHPGAALDEPWDELK